VTTQRWFYRTRRKKKRKEQPSRNRCARPRGRGGKEQKPNYSHMSGGGGEDETGSLSMRHLRGGSGSLALDEKRSPCPEEGRGEKEAESSH